MYFSPCVLLAALPYAAAFYPYLAGLDDAVAPVKATANDIIARKPPGDSLSIRVPLNRVPVRRNNEYKIITANTPTQSGSVGVDQDGTDFSYFSTFRFGTSNVEYHLLLDSGAANTWVMGSDCTTEACSKHNSLGDSDSDTLEITNTAFSIAYGTGNVNGTIAKDDVQISTYSVPLSFGLASYASKEFESYPMDGILGLGRADTTTSDVTSGTLIDALSKASLIPAKLYGIHLSRTSDGLNDGELNLGAPNPDRYDGSLSWTKAITNDRGFWEIPLDGASVDGKDAAGLTDRTAIIDTGTSFILMPGDDAAAVHALIPGTKRNGEIFAIPCDTQRTISLRFNGKAYNMSHKDYVGASHGDGTCQSNIIGRQSFGPKQWLVGEVFLKNVYTVFDQDEARIGFGVKADGGRTAAETSASPTASARATSGAASSAKASTEATASESGSASGTAAVSTATGAPLIGSASASSSGSGSGTSATAAAASASETHASVASSCKATRMVATAVFSALVAVGFVL
ncbi:uncharacterized protein K452DRAFT_226932 [Aplosporella prunicola CBS 121167]|uniref:Peptidase A1 domain-containing protein n=1 Tax=Aplosporella prunicola CBS 121167 TaxID=1176127 RepID=A0A6A6BI40_9PEZI|nr:uncharacterized protein K452DRAFT_226932 [Aplosporella prunicola CBS 121167]KAF2142517.1 hypothetical protein K452DRAFT_226932 [Aplosporella prunicola CBS 121167]